VAALESGQPFPSIALRDEKGRPASPPSRPALYGFFKTTCPTCELAWPYFDRVSKLAEGGRLSVLGVSQDDPRATASFYQSLGVSLPTLYDPEPWEASHRLGLETVPSFLLVGENGVVEDFSAGFQRHKMEEYAGLAARLAGRPAPALFLPGENVAAWKPG
jgi:thiol-disulfide isomerase/thioredoxin